jgi:hypothetical protein
MFCVNWRPEHVLSTSNKTPAWPGFFIARLNTMSGKHLRPGSQT